MYNIAVLKFGDCNARCVNEPVRCQIESTTTYTVLHTACGPWQVYWQIFATFFSITLLSISINNIVIHNFIKDTVLKPFSRCLLKLNIYFNVHTSSCCSTSCWELLVLASSWSSSSDSMENKSYQWFITAFR